jgi:hypothetical protein
MQRKLDIVQENRKSLIMQVRPGGLEVRVPAGMAPEGERVWAFIDKGLRDRTNRRRITSWAELALGLTGARWRRPAVGPAVGATHWSPS